MGQKWWGQIPPRKKSDYYLKTDRERITIKLLIPSTPRSKSCCSIWARGFSWGGALEFEMAEEVNLIHPEEAYLGLPLFHPQFFLQTRPLK